MHDEEASEGAFHLDRDDGVRQPVLHGIQDVAYWAKESLNLILIELQRAEQRQIFAGESAVIEGFVTPWG